MDVKILDLSTRAQWSSMLSSLPEDQQDIYFTPEFYELAKFNNEGEPRCFVFTMNDEIALYPYAYGSINELDFVDLDKEYFDIQGAYGYNGVVSSSYDPEFIKAFFSSLTEYCMDSNIITDFTRFHPIIKNEQFSKSYMKVSFNRETVSLDLSHGYDYLWENLYTSKNRNMIRKALKNDLSYRVYTKGEACDRFYAMYTENMRRLNAYEFYFFTEDYFRNIVSLMPKNHCYIEVIHENDIIAALTLFHYGQYAHYHLSARDGSKANLGASNFALDAAVRYSLEKGCRHFYLGGGISKTADDTLLKFKGSLSKERMDFLIGTKIHNKDIYEKICTFWAKRYPEKKEKYAGILLKYRV